MSMDETLLIEKKDEYSSPEDFVEKIKPYVKDVKNILEIGALDGRDGKIIQSFFPGAHLYMFEGLDANYEKFLKGLPPEQTAWSVVLWDKNENIIFWENEQNGIHSIRPHRNGLVKKVYKTAHRFDTFAAFNKIPQPDIVKLDVEGAAYEVLIGMGKLLKNVQALHVESESYPYFQGQTLEPDVFKLLEKTHRMIQKTVNTVDELGKQTDTIWVKKS